MPKQNQTPKWQDVRRTLASKSQRELLNLIRDVYALNAENQDFVRAQALAPKTPPRPKATVKAIERSEASKAAPKICRLAQVAAELREGDHCNITRLTTLKSLCEDAKAAAQFAFHIAQQTYKNMQERDCPSHLEPETWNAYKKLVTKALGYMEAYVEEPSEQARGRLWSVESEVRGVQNTYKQHQWGPVRIIQSSDVLLTEYTLSCLLQPTVSADWGYRIARQYAERYNSRYGTGLIPESAPMVEDIADFWCQYHVGKPLQEWLGAS